MLLLAAAYLASGWLGLRIPYFGSHITLVWLPTGIAVAALLRWGTGVWPGVYFGAFAVNLAVGSSPLLAAAIAIGNTLAPLVSVGWLRRLKFHPAFAGQKDVGKLIAAAAVGMTISALGGVASLYIAGLLPFEKMAGAWLSWWMGDSVGVLLAAPLFLTLSRDSIEQLGRRRGDLLLWLLVAGPVAWMAFFQEYQELGRQLPLAFMTLPLVSWAALSFGITGAALAGLGFSVLAAAGVAVGRGTFFLPMPEVSQFLTWAYMATTVLTGMLITTLQAERQKADATLRESEARFRLLAASTFEGIAMTEHGRFVDANDQLLRMLGYARDELIGRAIADLLPAGDREPVLGNVRSGRESHVEHAMLCQDGSRILVEAHGQTIRSDGREIRITALRDITARKQGEAELELHRHHLEDLVQQRTAALLETEARASHILASSAAGLYGIDAGGTVTFINPAACEMLGYRADEIIGRRGHALFHHSRADGSPYPDDECPSHKALLRGEKVRIDHEVYWHADGHALPVMYAVHPMLAAGKAVGAVVSFVDMSEQRAAAQAREQALAVAENLARVRSEFLANMSHEIRTPLNGVLGFAEIGSRHYQDAERARDAFAKIRHSGKRLLGVINDVLDFSKIEAGKLQIEATKVVIGEVVGHALELVRARADAKGLDLRVDLAADLPASCVSDPLRLGQVLLNVLSNAVKFTERGGVTVSVSRSVSSSASPADPSRDELVFRIADTGIGMGEAQLAVLFSPFQQADASATRRFGGTGLGLAISKRIVELMRGRIEVHSQPGGGTCVDFRVPYVAAGTGAAAAPGDAEMLAGRPLAGVSILVAEDEESNRAILVELLEGCGARVQVVGNGCAAIDCVRYDGAGAYDIVLMDIQMPDIDGYAATRAIHALAPGLPVIAQTAHAFREEREKCLAAGMVAHLAKPIDAAALVRLISEHLGGRRGEPLPPADRRGFTPDPGPDPGPDFGSDFRSNTDPDSGRAS